MDIPNYAASEAYRDLLKCIEKASVPAYSIASPNPAASSITRKSFVLDRQVREYLCDDGYREMKRLLKECPPPFRKLPVEAQSVAEKCPKICCILAETGRFDMIGTFSSNPELWDDRLPFHSVDQHGKPPKYFPRVPRDDTFFAKFYEAQWKFCAPKVGSTRNVDIPDKYILPFAQVSDMKVGNTARVQKVHVHEDFDDIGRDDRSHVYAVKTYQEPNAYGNYRREYTAFKSLTDAGARRRRGIVAFYGGFSHHGCYSILLEWASGGTLEDFLTQSNSPIRPPVDTTSHIDLYGSLFELVYGLHWIHDLDGSMHGWHQDLKPTNILVVAAQQTPSYNGFVFKIGDLGLSDFKPATNHKDKESLTMHRWGTETYGAPECYALSASTVQRHIQIDKTTDVWSLACMLDEAVHLVARDAQGVQDYRRARREAHEEGFRVPDCFHDGHEALPLIRDQHRVLRDVLRRCDTITEDVIDKLITPILFPKTGQRPKAEEVVQAMEGVVKSAKQKSQTTGEGADHVSKTTAKKSASSVTSMGSSSDQHSAVRVVTEIQPSANGSKASSSRGVYSGAGTLKCSSHPVQAPQGRVLASSSGHGTSGQHQSSVNEPRKTELPYCSVDNGLKWLRNMRDGNATSIKNLDRDGLLDQLKQRDHVFMIDDSRSMKQHWDSVLSLVQLLVKVVKPADPNGPDLYFLGSTTGHKVKRASRAGELITQHTPHGMSQLTLLENDIDTHIDKLERSSRRRSSLFGGPPLVRTVYVITDGKLEGGDEHQGHRAIKALATNLSKSIKGRAMYGIQFIQMGNDADGVRRLEELDQLSHTFDLGIDLVDTEPANGNLFKMLLGAINDKFDCDPGASMSPLAKGPPAIQ